MTKFSKKCFCKKSTAEIKLAKGFKRGAIDIVWCPFCANRASAQALLINVTHVPEMLGIWAIKYNPAVLKEVDKDFLNKEDYYIKLFKSGKCTLAGFALESKKPKYRILGMRQNLAELNMKQYLSGPDYLMTRTSEKPHKLPKDARSSPEESYSKFKGYKS